MMIRNAWLPVNPDESATLMVKAYRPVVEVPLTMPVTPSSATQAATHRTSARKHGAML
jgi:hypothetical protein